MRTIPINSEITLSPLAKSDSNSLVKYLNDLTVYENMLVIPYPYTLAHAEWFINKVIEDEQNEDLAIRYNGELIGIIGFKYPDINAHKDEIGYWLAAPFRNKGIMTLAVKAFCADAFKRSGLQRIEAIPFHFNESSPKVLEKAGFKFEGILRNYFKKDGNVFDGKLYSLTPDDLK